MHASGSSCNPAIVKRPATSTPEHHVSGKCSDLPNTIVHGASHMKPANMMPRRISMATYKVTIGCRMTRTRIHSSVHSSCHVNNRLLMHVPVVHLYRYCSNRTHVCSFDHCLHYGEDGITTIRLRPTGSSLRPSSGEDYQRFCWSKRSGCALSGSALFD
jgi:hypothetical protein